MLGIFLIICIAVFLLLKLKAHNLLKDDYIELVTLDSNIRTYKVCYRAVKLHTISLVVMLIGYLGCIWPYLFIEEINRIAYFVGIFTLGLFPIPLTIYVCYLNIKSAKSYIRISADKIEYKRHKSFSININDIKTITLQGIYSCQIHLKEKGKKPLHINLTSFYKKKEILSLIKQIRDYSVEVSVRKRSLIHKLSPWEIETRLGKYFFVFFIIFVVLPLLYASYCCIDYDFFKKDYIALFNALGADPNQSENAWSHYVQAAVNYKKLEEDLQEIIDDNLKSGHLNLTDEQEDDLKKWFEENKSSWSSLKKATSINYCNIAYENISLVDSMGRDDFSNPSDTGYRQLRHLYSNINACRLAGILDLDWFDLFRMQLTSSKHFTNGKSLIDQLVGYAMLRRSIKLLAKQDNYELDDLQKVRTSFEENFPDGLPSLSIEGEIFMICSSFERMINLKKIPVQTPLNPMFLMFGSSTGSEAYVRKAYTTILELAQKGLEVEPKGFSIINFPIMRKMLFSILEGNIPKVYKVSERADTNLLAAYFLLDLEEHQLIKGCYPADVSQLRQVGLTSQLPDDPDTNGKIIYRNDREKAILYAVGKNAKDDCGYKDDKEKDDIIYWQRNLK